VIVSDQLNDFIANIYQLPKLFFIYLFMNFCFVYDDDYQSLSYSCFILYIRQISGLVKYIYICFHIINNSVMKF